MATSIIQAFFDKYNSIPAALFPDGKRPPLQLSEMSQTNSGGQQQRVPYCVLDDGGQFREVMSDNSGPQSGEATLRIVYSDIGDADRAALAVRFNGGPPVSRAGLDGGTLELDSPFAALSCVLVSETRSYLGIGPIPKPSPADPSGLGPIHQVVQVYHLVSEVRANG